MRLLGSATERVRKALALGAMVAGLFFGTHVNAWANAWDFSYTGSGVTVSGTFSATLNAQGIWDITSVTGTRNGDPIAGLWCGLCQTLQPGYGSSDNYFIDAAVGAPGGPGWVDPQLDLHFLVGTDRYILAYIENYNLPIATETDVTAALPGNPTLLDYPSTGRCAPNSPGCTVIESGEISAVPEINASAGLGALGALFGFVLIFREMFMRRRREMFAA